MIDEKKIEEAARKRLYAFRKANPDGYSSSIIDIESDCLDNFKAGAHWAIQEFLKDLWHPASEEPNKNKICIAEVTYHGLATDETAFEETSYHDFGWADFNFKYQTKDYNINRWLYIDDLIEQKGGE